MSTPKIKIEKINKAFGKINKFNLFDDFSVDIQSGEFVSIIGPSGCGKTTLIRMIAGFENIDQGQIIIDEKGEVPNAMGFVFQEPTLLPWLNILENLELALKIRNQHWRITSLQESQIKKSCLVQLERVGLLKFQNHFPHELSGGMKMRASLARSLVIHPKILLLDEPFAALDEITRFELQEELFKLWQETKMTIVFVTHSIYEACFLSQRIIMLQAETNSELRSIHLQTWAKGVSSAARNSDYRYDDGFLRSIKEVSLKFHEIGISKKEK